MQFETQPRNAAETQNERNMVQVSLMMRYPQGEMAWSARYNRAFRELFVTDEFYALVHEAHFSPEDTKKQEALTRIQDILEDAVQRNPDLLKDEFEN